MKYLALLFIISTSVYSLSEYDLNIFEKNKINHKTKKIKYLLLQGYPLKAQAVFNTHASLFQKAGLYNYYESIFSFVNKNYKKVKELIPKTKKLNGLEAKKVCQLQVVSKLFINDTQDLQSVWSRCSQTGISFNNQDQLWSKLLIEHFEFKSNIFHQSRFTVYRHNISELKIWLKLALFLNKAEEVNDFLLNLPTSYYKDKELKEIVSQLYYQAAQIQLSYQMSEELNSSRTRLIRANLHIAKDQYEPATQKLEELLKRDPASISALNRLIQLTYLHSQYDETLKWIRYYKKLKSKLPLDYLWKKALIHIERSNHKLAADAIAEYRLQAKEIGDISVYHLLKYLAFQDGNKKEALYYALRSCERGDDTGCWLTLIMKKNFEKLSNLEIPYKDPNTFIDKLKTNQLPQVKKQITSFARPQYTQSDLNHMDMLEKTGEHFIHSD